jgi:hypothetical protein
MIQCKTLWDKSPMFNIMFLALNSIFSNEKFRELSCFIIRSLIDIFCILGIFTINELRPMGQKSNVLFIGLKKKKKVFLF